MAARIIVSGTADGDYGIQVTDPSVVVGSFMQKHVEYKVISDKGKPENGPIMRRYNHFIWLHNRFMIERPGAIMPPLPPKQKGWMRFSEVFIEDRRECLEIYLISAMMNPELSTSPSLDIFLHCGNIIFNQLVNTKDETVMAAMMTNFSDQEVVENKSVKLRSGAKRFAAKGLMLKTDLVTSEDDEIFDEAAKSVPVLLKEIKVLAREASDLVKRSVNSSQDYSSLGKSFEKISEVEEGDLSLSCEQMGLAAQEQSALATKKAQDIKKTFVRPVTMFIGTVAGINTALANRKALHDELCFFIQHLQLREKKKDSMDQKLASAEDAAAAVSADAVVEDAAVEAAADMTPEEAEKAAKAAERAAARAEAAKLRSEKSAALLYQKNEEVQILRDEYDAMSKRLLRELERFNTEKIILMNTIIEGFATLEAKCNADMEKNWSSLGTKLASGLEPEKPALEPEKPAVPIQSA